MRMLRDENSGTIIFGQPLQTGRQIDCIADNGPFHPVGLAKRAKNHPACIDPHPHLEAVPSFGGGCFVVSMQFPLHGDRSRHSIARRLLEKRHDAIPHEFVDIAVIGADDGADA